MSEPRSLQPWGMRRSAIERLTPRQYTTSLKLAGNAVITATALVLFVPVVFLFAMGAFGAIPAAAGVFVAIVWALTIVEQGSLWANRRLRDSAADRLTVAGPELKRGALGFVGVCTPSYLVRQIWHSDMAHEDVGTLSAASGALIFSGDRMRVTIPRAVITSIAWRTNLWHPFCPLFGIRWIVVSYSEDGHARHLFIQSRDKDRLSQLAACNRTLFDRLQAWRGRPALAAERGAA
jgi:hypothetical protein